ncbi:MAG: beta-1,6-N-acetylglucosaminyltransferase [Fibrobacter sp.]|nr:beta-1,6-N-acetylglucosaminyltransferase [Fibrobacter sp.]
MAEPLRINYLIMAYDNPEVLNRAIDQLSREPHIIAARFYIHLDKKVNIRSYQDVVPERENVVYLAKRKKVNWMGFSMVEEILELLAESAKCGADYHFLMSDSDYPIKSNQAIRETISGNADDEYISFWNFTDIPAWSHKIEHYYPTNLVSIREYYRNTRKFNRFFWKHYFRLVNKFPKRKYPFDLIPYGGATWWMLTQGCVQYILNFVHSNPRFVKFYRTTHSPEEMFFQTIVLNSDFRTKVHNYHLYEPFYSKPENNGKHIDTAKYTLGYTDWSGVSLRGVKRGLPAFLDDSDFARLCNSECIFARKFNMKDSSLLIQMLNEQVLS